MKSISIILTHWSQNEFRSSILRQCLGSIIKTTKHLPVEIIVGDNGNNLEDSRYLLDLVANNQIQHYFRNAQNLYFGFCRNIGYGFSLGDYLVFSDNDIEYKERWLEKCIKILEAFPDDKIAVTPLRTDRQHRQEKHWTRWFELDGERFPANMRAGSNSWVMRRSDFEIIGKFRNHHIAGTKWTDEFVKKGYTMVTMEKEPMAVDIGFKQGYNFKYKAEIAKFLTNGEKIILNN